MPESVIYIDNLQNCKMKKYEEMIQWSCYDVSVIIIFDLI